MGLALNGAWASTDINVSPSPQVTLTDAEKTPLRGAFLKALGTEVKALAQRNRQELADLRASQKARRAELTASRREFFKNNPEPAKRREFMKDLLSRRRALEQLMAAEWKGRKSDHQAAQKSLQEDQKRRLLEFDAALKEGRRPSDLLWTSPGM
jgi:hypothetical protein